VPGEPTRFAAFVSGTGRTIRNLADEIDAGRLDAAIALVVASRECPGVDWARDRGIATHVHRGTLRASDVDRLLTGSGASWGVMGGYTRLLPIPPGFANRVTNIHPALLPSFGGPGMFGSRVHRAVLEAGCRVSGCTVHLCDGAYDTGPIVAQSCCPVEAGDTPETLASRVFGLELRTYPAALGALFRGGWSIEGRRVRMME
jgi:folate-dependent phosphoribosylglycinamide formyltransferase PurN